MNLLSGLLPIFAETVLPVLLVALAGLVVSRLMELDGKTLGRVLFYIASPSLVFRSLYQMELDRSVLVHVLIVSGIAMLVTTALGWIAGWNLPRRERAAIALTSGISNNGNMGIPISLFAFGDVALSLASVYYVVSAFMTNTVGSVVASAGRAPLAAALGQVLRVPVVYAAVGGLIMNQMQWKVPSPLFRSVDILAEAAIPCMLVLLGIQLRNPEVLRKQPGVGRSAAIRLLVGPAVAWGLCLALGIGGLERNVLIAQAAMPTAVVTSVLATEFDTAPRLVATVIVASTLLSMITVSVVLSMLR